MGVGLLGREERAEVGHLRLREPRDHGIHGRALAPAGLEVPELLGDVGGVLASRAAGRPRSSSRRPCRGTGSSGRPRSCGPARGRRPAPPGRGRGGRRRRRAARGGAISWRSSVCRGENCSNDWRPGIRGRPRLLTGYTSRPERHRRPCSKIDPRHEAGRAACRDETQAHPRPLRRRVGPVDGRAGARAATTSSSRDSTSSAFPGTRASSASTSSASSTAWRAGTGARGSTASSPPTSSSVPWPPRSSRSGSGLPHTPLEAVLAAQHKYYARQAFERELPECNTRFGLVGRDFRRTRELPLAFPFYIKPVKAAFSVLARRDRFLGRARPPRALLLVRAGDHRAAGAALRRRDARALGFRGRALQPHRRGNRRRRPGHRERLRARRARHHARRGRFPHVSRHGPVPALPVSLRPAARVAGERGGCGPARAGRGRVHPRHVQRRASRVRRHAATRR